MPQNTAFVFFVTEPEYEKLKTACPSDFPFTYKQFVARVDEGVKHLAQTISAVKVYADVEDFLAWCANSKIQPDNKARSEYAIHIGRSKQLH